MKYGPGIETLSEKRFIGQNIKMSLANNRTGELWRKFMPRRKEITDNLTDNIYSLQLYDAHYFKDFDSNKEFIKWALVEVSNYNTIPNDMEAFTLTGGKYAVFQHRGSSNDASKFEYIFLDWLPNSPYLLDERPHFEILGSRYKNADPDSEEEIWIPIRHNGLRQF